MHMFLSRNLDEDSAVIIPTTGAPVNETLDSAQSQVQRAERALNERLTAARATQPEYTLVSVRTDLGTEVGIYVRGQSVESDWTFLKVHAGDHAQLLAQSLREQGAPVEVRDDVFHLNRGGQWEPSTSGFRASSDSERLAAQINARFRKADALEAEWRNNDRWGDSGARSLRQQAEYSIARLKTLDPSYPVHTLRTGLLRRGPHRSR